MHIVRQIKINFKKKYKTHLRVYSGRGFCVAGCQTNTKYFFRIILYLITVCTILYKLFPQRYAHPMMSIFKRLHSHVVPLKHHQWRSDRTVEQAAASGQNGSIEYVMGRMILKYLLFYNCSLTL